jgi:hypothetical protein
VLSQLGQAGLCATSAVCAASKLDGGASAGHDRAMSNTRARAFTVDELGDTAPAEIEDEGLSTLSTEAMLHGDGVVASVLDGLLFARSKAREGDLDAAAFLSSIMERMVRFKDGYGQHAAVLSSSRLVSERNRTTAAKDRQLEDARALISTWCGAEASAKARALSKPKMKVGEFNHEEWQQAAGIAAAVAAANEPAVLLGAWSEKLRAMAFSMASIPHIATDIHFTTARRSRLARSDEVARLFPSVQSAWAMDAITAESLVVMVLRACGIPADKNYFSYRT